MGDTQEEIPVELIRGFILNKPFKEYPNLPSTAEFFFNKVLNHTTWHQILKTEDGSEVKLKRKMAYVHENGIPYRYSNLILPTESKWKHPLDSLLKAVRTVHPPLNSVLLNLYESGKDVINWHSDKEEQLGPNPKILCLNLGATRKFHFLCKATGEKTFYEVGNGDLLIMKENCQRDYLHAIRKEPEVKDARISLTFRYVKDNWDDKDS
jgi:alkylated DNA repair dioxygenase AlkB